MIRNEEVRTHILRCLALFLLLSVAGTAALGDGETAPARDAKQPVDDAYTAKIKKYTTSHFSLRRSSIISPLRKRFRLPKPFSAT